MRLQISFNRTDRQAPLNYFIEIVKQFLKCLSLRGASGNGGNFRPITALLSLMDYYFDFHGLIIVRLVTNRRASGFAA